MVKTKCCQRSRRIKLPSRVVVFRKLTSHVLFFRKVPSLDVVFREVQNHKKLTKVRRLMLDGVPQKRRVITV